MKIKYNKEFVHWKIFDKVDVCIMKLVDRKIRIKFLYFDINEVEEIQDSIEEEIQDFIEEEISK